MNHTRGPFTTSIFTAELSEEHDDVWGCDCIILYFLRPLIIIIVLFYYQTRITFSSNILFLPFEALALRWASFLLQHFNFEYPSFSPKHFFFIKNLPNNNYLEFTMASCGAANKLEKKNSQMNLQKART